MDMRLREYIIETNDETEKYLVEIIKESKKNLLKTFIEYCLHLKYDFDRTLFSRLFFEAFNQRKKDWKNYIGILCCFDIIDFSVLVIDDIIDNTSRRLGRKSPFKVWELGEVLATSMLLKSMATELVISTGNSLKVPPKTLIKIIRSIEDAHKAIYIGQFLDKEYENKKINEISIDEYLEMIRLTTGEHIGHSAEVGAILAGASSHGCILSRNIGCNIGVIMQIRDDFIDYIDKEEITGKPAFRDLLALKKRLPLLLMSKYHKDGVKQILRKKKIGKWEKRKVWDMVTDKRIINETKKIVRGISNKINEKIDKLPNAETRDYLRELMEIICALNVSAKK